MLKKQRPILLVANCFWYIYNFRLDLIKLLKASGCKIVVVAPPDSYKKFVREYVDEVQDWNLVRGSTNPLLEIRSIFELISFFFCL